MEPIEIFSPEQRLWLAVWEQARKDAQEGQEDARSFLAECKPIFQVLFHEYLETENIFHQGMVRHSH